MMELEESKNNGAIDQESQAQQNNDEDMVDRHSSKDGDEDKENISLDQAAESVPSANVAVGSAKKKRGNKKSKSKRGLTAPTGFEEFYVDAPLTAHEYEMEKGIYDLSNSFAQRIECAIQRYAAKRNMDSERKNVFDKYLAYGGIECGPKQFSGGLNAADLSDKSATDIALIKAIHFVAIDKDGDDATNYTVDFEGCAKSFFSTRMPLLFTFSSLNPEKDVKSRTLVIRNFLNYLLHHDVCPEYMDQIHAARRVCDLADKELPMTISAKFRLPGDFNLSCSELFGGSLQGIGTENPEWVAGIDTIGVGISPEKARQAFKVALAVHGSDELSRRYREQNAAEGVKIISDQDIGLEITGIMPTDDMIRHFYKSHPAAKGLEPVGKLRAKTWHSAYSPILDLTEEEALVASQKANLVEEYEFWVEDHVLEKCFVGMKLSATVRELSFGLKFFDSVFGVWCSFFTVLPNEAMAEWRKVEDEPLPMRKVESALKEIVDNESEEEQ